LKNIIGNNNYLLLFSLQNLNKLCLFIKRINKRKNKKCVGEIRAVESGTSKDFIYA